MESEADVGQTDVFKEDLLLCAAGLGDSVGQVLESLRNDSEGASLTPGLWLCSDLKALIQIWGGSRAGISQVAMYVSVS